MNIVVCDDSATIRTVMVDILGQIGMENITQCRTGAEALAQVRGGEVDILLIDIHMPEMDGMTAVEEIRTDDGRPVTTIFISSDTDPAKFKRARELGAFGFIKKPFKVDGVRRAIQEAVKQTQKRIAQENKSGVDTALLEDEQAAASNAGILKWLRRVMPRR